MGRGGKLTIAICSDRDIEYGEELTMDYCSITHQVCIPFVCVCVDGCTCMCMNACL